jgi:hypothetical protein
MAGTCPKNKIFFQPAQAIFLEKTFRLSAFSIFAAFPENFPKV